MEPVVLALASNERYFPGVYCDVASALSHLDSTREVDLKVLDGGISKHSKNTLCRLVERYGKVVGLQFVAVDESVFHDATLGPAESHMAYCRTLLPRLLDMSRLIYLDCECWHSAMYRSSLILNYRLSKRWPQFLIPNALTGR